MQPTGRTCRASDTGSGDRNVWGTATRRIYRGGAGDRGRHSTKSRARLGPMRVTQPGHPLPVRLVVSLRKPGTFSAPARRTGHFTRNRCYEYCPAAEMPPPPWAAGPTLAGGKRLVWLRRRPREGFSFLSHVHRLVSMRSCFSQWLWSMGQQEFLSQGARGEAGPPKDSRRCYESRRQRQRRCPAPGDSHPQLLA